MFSLVITIISIALVAALALATLFYGGQALNKGGDQAQATKLLNQSQQILGASDLFKADHGRWPYDLQELVNTRYLRTIPVGQIENDALRGAHAEEDVLKQWTTPLPGRPVYVTSDVSAGVCSKVNLMTMKVDAVYAGLVPEVNSQCFASGSEYKAVAAREWPAIPEAFPLATVASEVPVLTDPGWVVVEGRVLSPGEGGTEAAGGGTAGAPVLAVSALQHDFGARPLGSVNPMQVTVRNVGTAAMKFTNTPALSGDPAFALTSTNCGPSLAAGGECTVELSFTPAALAQASGSLAIDTNATASAVVVPLSGSGLGSVTTLSSDSLAFGAQTVGGSTSQPLTVRNEGSAAFDFTQLPVVSGNASFSLASTTCGAVLAAGAQCTVTVSFTPASRDAVTGSLTFASNGAPYAVSLTGSGLSPSISLSSQALAFGARTVGTSTVLSLTVSNTGNAAAAVSQLPVVGGDSAFSLSSTTCTSAVDAGSSCGVDVQFTPVLPGAVTGELAFTLHGVSYNIPLSGSGQAARLRYENSSGVAITTTAFGSVTQGQNSGSQVLTLRNIGDANLFFNTAVTGGTEFKVSSTTCTSGLVLAPNATCTATVYFSPAASGARSGSLVVDSTAYAPGTLIFTGTGIAPTGSYLASASGSWTVPAYVTRVKVTLVGGGGGGGGGYSCSCGTAGGGGGGGGATVVTISVTPGEVLSLAIGGGGYRGSKDANGSAGSPSSIARGGVTLAQAGGGSGGEKGTYSTGAGAGGGGGSGTYRGGNGGSGSSGTGGWGGGAGRSPDSTENLSGGYGNGGAGGNANYIGAGGNSGAIRVSW